jgi:hypothetical protein
LKLKPHHVLDIVSHYGEGRDFQPHPYGHAVHTVAQALIANQDLTIEFTLGADDICQPCRHRQADGRCDDVLAQLPEKPSKHDYNLSLDKKLFACFGFPAGRVMTFRAYLEIVTRYLPGLERICSHPGENPASRLAGLQKGLVKLGLGPA